MISGKMVSVIQFAGSMSFDFQRSFLQFYVKVFGVVKTHQDTQPFWIIIKKTVIKIYIEYLYFMLAYKVGYECMNASVIDSCKRGMNILSIGNDKIIA